MTNQIKRNHQKDHAIILGGSLAGLLTARILSQHFHRVTIIEKDNLTGPFAPRKGVPQGKHMHILLARGLQIMEHYLPGLTADLAAGGAVVMADQGLDLRWFIHGSYRPRVATGLKSVMATRPFLEGTIRQRVTALPNVELITGKVAQLVTTDDHQRITGVRLAGNVAQELTADLVIDATGRGSKSATWLSDLGYAPPRAEEVGVKIRYASQLFRRTQPTQTLTITSAQPPDHARQGAMQPVEDDRLIVMLHGRGDENPPANEAGFKAYARSLLAQDIADTIEDLTPVSDIALYNIPKTRWYHYEKLTRFPAGYLVLGDAVCALNPVYGQGMTAAAMQVEVLDQLLTQQPLSDRFWRPYFKKIAKVIEVPWQVTAGEDFLFPQTEGAPPKMPSFLVAYMDKLNRTVNHDPEVFKVFANVMNLVKPPTVLFHPRIVWRVLRHKEAAVQQTPDQQLGQRSAKAA